MQLQQTQKNLQKAEYELDLQKEAMQVLKQELDKKTRDNAQQLQELERLKADNRAMLASQPAAKDQVKQLQQQVETLQASQHSLEKENQDLQKKIESLKKRLVQEEEVRKELQALVTKKSGLANQNEGKLDGNVEEEEEDELLKQEMEIARVKRRKVSNEEQVGKQVKEEKKEEIEKKEEVTKKEEKKEKKKEESSHKRKQDSEGEKKSLKIVEVPIQEEKSAHVSKKAKKNPPADVPNVETDEPVENVKVATKKKASSKKAKLVADAKSKTKHEALSLGMLKKSTG